MSLNAVQTYVYNLLNGTHIDSYDQDLQVFIAPPVPDDMATIHCYIWGASFNESRQTAPRGPAFKQVEYNLNLYMFVAEDPNGPTTDTNFPAAMEQVMSILRTTPMPVMIQDPITTVESQLLVIGEQFEVQYDVERMLSDQRYVRLLALITANITEVIVG